MTIEKLMSLKALRARAGMTQYEAARAIDVDRATISKWEKDASNMPVKYMLEFAKLYKYSLDNIFFGSSIVLSDKIKNSNLEKQI